MCLSGLFENICGKSIMLTLTDANSQSSAFSIYSYNVHSFTTFTVGHVTNGVRRA